MARGRLRTWLVLLTVSDGVRETSGRRVPPGTGGFFFLRGTTTAAAELDWPLSSGSSGCSAYLNCVWFFCVLVARTPAMRLPYGEIYRGLGMESDLSPGLSPPPFFFCPRSPSPCPPLLPHPRLQHIVCSPPPSQNSSPPPYPLPPLLDIYFELVFCDGRASFCAENFGAPAS
jgi:hypothetical protein